MKQVSYVISTYTSDVSGVCSALYELGGMVVIHDPSGCNSTYNTHDEPRWFDQDSLIFISGLSQMDAVMGNDDKFIDEILRGAEELHPRFIALVRSPIPLMIGTDFEGIAREIETRSGIPTFFVPTTGMKSYVKGAGMALEMVVNRLMPEKKEIINQVDEGKKKISVNILGATPLDFSVNESYACLKKILLEEGFHIQGSLALETDYEEMQQMPYADVNLVVTACGFAAAKAMKERYGIPYVIGLPTGCLRSMIMEDLRKAAVEKCDIDRLSLCELVINRREPSMKEMKEVRLLVHEPVIARSLAIAYSWDNEKKVCPVSMTDLPDNFPRGFLITVESEEEMANHFAQASYVMADPMFKPICPKKVKFSSLAHEAFSGRIYRKTIPNLLIN